jgi:hypothetical protein
MHVICSTWSPNLPLIEDISSYIKFSLVAFMVSDFYTPLPPSSSVQSYTKEPPSDEAIHDRLSRPSGEFVKKSKNGGVSLRLFAQADDATLPVYGSGASVRGSVELSESKLEGLASVEIKVHLRGTFLRSMSTDHLERSKAICVSEKSERVGRTRPGYV